MMKGSAQLADSEEEHGLLAMPEISLVIAAMNEEEGIGECLERAKSAFEEHHIDGEIVVADNSTDRSPAIAVAAGARVVTPDRLGYSYACAVGIRHSRGKYIVLSDADGTYDIADLPRFLQPLRDGQADLVIGSRFGGGIRDGAMPWLHRYIGNPLLTWGLNLALGTRVSDAHCGIRAFTREAWDRMDLTFIAEDFCSEMLRQMAKNKARIQDMPVAYFQRRGRAKAGTLLHGWRCFRFLLWRIFLRVPI